MKAGQSMTPGAATKVVVLTADGAFEQSVRETFGASTLIDLDLVAASLSDCADALQFEGATVVIVDVDAGADAELAALERLMLRVGHGPPVVAVTQSFEASHARRLMQMR